jgi:hypothetical protein
MFLHPLPNWNVFSWRSFLFDVYQAHNLSVTYTEIITEIRYRYLPPAGSEVKRPYVEIVALVWNGILSEQLPEDGRNRWPKHVAGYGIYNAINLHMCSVWSCISQFRFEI